MSDSTTPDQADKLKAIFAQLQALDEEAQAIAAEKRDALKAAKLLGFDGPTLTKMVQRARKDPQDVIDADQLLEQYEAVVGSGAAAAGVLSMQKNADGFFEAKILQGPDAAADKLSRRDKARRDALASAELARRAREAG